MTYAMSNKFFALLLTGLLFGNSLFAEMYAPDSLAPPSSAPTNSKAELGNIFGSQDMGGDINYHVFDISEHTPGHAALRSTLAPGWGQLYNGEERKGILMLSFATVLAVSALATYNDAQKSYDDYTATGEKNGSLYTDYSNKLTLTWVLSGALLVLWGSSIYDAAHRANRTAELSHIQMALNEKGDPSLNYQRRF